MSYTYILYNSLLDRYYIGHTSDLDKRLVEHNKGIHKVKYTRKFAGEWILVYYESFNTRSEAMNRERKIKSWKSRNAIVKLISKVGKREQSR